MHNKHLPLILFTLFVQAAVGTFIAAAFLTRIAGRALDTSLFTDISSVAVLAQLIAGAIAAATHLGKPERAHLAGRNAKSSWLSREMIFSVLFGLSVVFYVATNLLNTSSQIKDTAALAGAVFGIALVYSISRLYMLRTVPSWNTVVTPISFFLAAFLLGTVTAGLVFIAIYNAVDGEVQYRLLAWKTLHHIGILSVILALLQTLTLRFRAKKNPVFAIPGNQRLLMVRTALSYLGAILFWVSTLKIRQGGDPNLILAAIGLPVVFAGEFIGRILFFSSYDKVGL